MRTKWTNDKVKEEIFKVINGLELKNFMPTKKQMDKFTGSFALSNKVAKSGGWQQWSEKLDLKLQNNETNLGKKFEKELEFFLENNYGYKIIQMPTRFPYDVLVEDFIKVDVKCGKLYKYSTGNYFSFNLETNNVKCDLFVCYCIENDNIIKTYIIPSFILQGKTQLSIGKENSIYNKYINRWDLFEKYLNFKNDLNIK